MAIAGLGKREKLYLPIIGVLGFEVLQSKLVPLPSFA